MLTVLAFLWKPDTDSRYSIVAPYGLDDVRSLQRMVARHLTVPHRFVVMTDRPELFANDRDIQAVPLDARTHVPGTCFVRLATFAPDARATLGERVLRVDLDTIIVGNIDALVDRNEDLVMWRNPTRWWMEERQGTPRDRINPKKYGFWCGSLLLHRTETMTHLWTAFDRNKPPAQDDDHYLSDALGPDIPYWDQRHGVYRLVTNPMWSGSGVDGDLPANARAVFFPGTKKPWLPEVRAKCPWIDAHYTRELSS